MTDIEKLIRQTFAEYIVGDNQFINKTLILKLEETLLQKVVNMQIPDGVQKLQTESLDKEMVLASIDAWKILQDDLDYLTTGNVGHFRGRWLRLADWYKTRLEKLLTNDKSK